MCCFRHHKVWFFSVVEPIKVLIDLNYVSPEPPMFQTGKSQDFQSLWIRSIFYIAQQFCGASLYILNIVAQ